MIHFAGMCADFLIHHYSYKEVDRCFLGTDVPVPDFMVVNSPSIMGGETYVHPPEIDLWQPMHENHRRAMDVAESQEGVIFRQIFRNEEL